MAQRESHGGASFRMRPRPSKSLGCGNRASHQALEGGGSRLWWLLVTVTAVRFPQRDRSTAGSGSGIHSRLPLVTWTSVLFNNSIRVPGSAQKMPRVAAINSNQNHTETEPALVYLRSRWRWELIESPRPGLCALGTGLSNAIRPSSAAGWDLGSLVPSLRMSLSDPPRCLLSLVGCGPHPLWMRCPFQAASGPARALVMARGRSGPRQGSGGQ